MGYYATAILGTVLSFFIGCLWYSVLFGKVWQAGMGFSDEKIKTIFVPKRIISAFICEWMAGFCLLGLFNFLPVNIFQAILMIATVLIFSSIKLAIFDGKSIKVILINQGYILVTILLFAGLFSFVM